MQIYRQKKLQHIDCLSPGAVADERTVIGSHGKTKGMNQLVEQVKGYLVAMERGSAEQQTGTDTSAPIAAEQRSGKRVR